MTKTQSKKLYGVNGTKRLRKQWQKARDRNKVPNNYKKLPNIKNIEL